MRHRNNIALGSVLLGLCLTASLSAQTAHPSGRVNRGPLEASGGEAYQSWVNAKWTGDERPYLKIKADIDAAVAHGTPTPALVARYEGPANANWLDAKAQYAWAYATQLQWETGPGIAQPPPLYGLRRLGAPDCYPVARVRFLLTQEMELNGDHLYLRPVASRLLKRDPNDRTVRRAQIQALASNRAGLPEALKLAEGDVALSPTKPGRHMTLAGVYETLYGYSRGRNATYRQRTIQEYQAYLKYAKPDDSFRPHAAQLVKVMQTEKPW